MSTRKPGRPPRNEAATTPQAILAAALEMLDSTGANALTMRDLAARLGVNPMTIYHHFGDRNGLIKAMAEQVYASVFVPDSTPPRQRVEALLLSYHKQVVQHPALTLSIFANPAVFPDHARRISDSLMLLMQELGLSPADAQRWLHILVDFTHGSGLATAMNGRDASEANVATTEHKHYAEALRTLLKCLRGEAQTAQQNK